MKSCIVLCVLSVVVMALARPEEEDYTNRYDNSDVDEIYSDHRLTVHPPFIKCILGQGMNAPDAKGAHGAHQEREEEKFTTKYEEELKEIKHK